MILYALGLLRPASELSDGEKGADVDYSRIDRVMEVRAAAAAVGGGHEATGGTSAPPTSTHKRKGASKLNISINPTSQCSGKAGRICASI